MFKLFTIAALTLGAEAMFRPGAACGLFIEGTQSSPAVMVMPGSQSAPMIGNMRPRKTVSKPFLHPLFLGGPTNSGQFMKETVVCPFPGGCGVYEYSSSNYRKLSEDEAAVSGKTLDNGAGWQGFWNWWRARVRDQPTIKVPIVIRSTTVTLPAVKPQGVGSAVTVGSDFRRLSENERLLEKFSYNTSEFVKEVNYDASTTPGDYTVGWINEPRKDAQSLCATIQSILKMSDRYGNWECEQTGSNGVYKLMGVRKTDSRRLSELKARGKHIAGVATFYIQGTRDQQDNLRLTFATCPPEATNCDDRDVEGEDHISNVHGLLGDISLMLRK